MSMSGSKWLSQNKYVSVPAGVTLDINCYTLKIFFVTKRSVNHTCVHGGRVWQGGGSRGPPNSIARWGCGKSPKIYPLGGLWGFPKFNHQGGLLIYWMTLLKREKMVKTDKKKQFLAKKIGKIFPKCLVSTILQIDGGGGIWRNP